MLSNQKFGRVLSMLENNIATHQVSCLLGVPKDLDIAKWCHYQVEQHANMLSLSYLSDMCPMQSWHALLNNAHADQAAGHITRPERWFSSQSYYQTMMCVSSWEEPLNIETHPLWLENIKYIQQTKQLYPKALLKFSLPGPLTYLWFNHYLGQSKNLSEDKLALLPKLIYQYKQILQMLKEQGITWIQLDDPVFITDVSSEYQESIIKTYQQLLTEAPSVMLATYFGGIEENLNWLKNIPFQGLHIDLEAAPEQIMFVLKNDIMKNLKVLSLGGIKQSDSYFSAIQSYMASFIKCNPEIWIGFSRHLEDEKIKQLYIDYEHEKIIDIVKIYMASNLDCPPDFPKILALKNYITSLKNQYPDIKFSIDSLKELTPFIKKRDKLNFIQHVESLVK